MRAGLPAPFLIPLASSAISDHLKHVKTKVKSVPEARCNDITAAWKRTKKRLDQMNKDEILETFVSAGILTKNGNLTAPYRGVFVKAKS